MPGSMHLPSHVALRAKPCRARRCLRVVAHAHQASANTSTKGYLEELRKAAIKLHTREQLNPNSKGAKQNTEPAPPPRRTPKLQGYLKYLAESKAVFDTLERIVATSNDPALAPFKHTGLERGDALAKDLQWFEENKHLKAPTLKPEGTGLTYSRLLEKLAAEDLPSFMCHYYNVYFAHTAGGLMIGKSISNAILDGVELEFYKFGGDPKEIGLKVKEDINAMAEQWDAESTQRSVAQTADCFKFAGSMMACITQSCDCDCVKE